MPTYDFENTRREYNAEELLVSDVNENPFQQFKSWFDHMLETKLEDPTAAALATVDENNCPDCRVILIKGCEADRFVFYTNYSSRKGQHLAQNPNAALNFYWPSLCRQIRVRGKVSKVSPELSQKYFSIRPRNSQLAAMASKQSSEISRKDLEQRFNQLEKDYRNKPIECPEYWGGYALHPTEFEFWHGRLGRMHARVQYILENKSWVIRQIAP